MGDQFIVIHQVAHHGVDQDQIAAEGRPHQGDKNICLDHDRCPIDGPDQEAECGDDPEQQHAGIEQGTLAVLAIQPGPDRSGQGDEDDQHALVDAHIAFRLAQHQRDEIREVCQHHLVSDVNGKRGEKKDQELLVLECSLEPFHRGHRITDRTVGLAQPQQRDINGGNAHQADHRSHGNSSDALEQRRSHQRADQYTDDPKEALPVAQAEPRMGLGCHLRQAGVVWDPHQAVAGVIDQDDHQEVGGIERVVAQAGRRPEQDRSHQDKRRSEHQEGPPASPAGAQRVGEVTDERVDYRIPEGGDQQQYTHRYSGQVGGATGVGWGRIKIQQPGADGNAKNI